MSKAGAQAVEFLQKALGNDVFVELKKFEIINENTQTAIDHEEVKTALQIVPRAILAILQRELEPMSKGDNKEIPLPCGTDAHLHVTKIGPQLYMGEIRQAGTITMRFKNRTIPGIGLIVMTTFEMYDDVAVQQSAKMPEDIASTVQKLIDDRLSLRDTIERVVDRKISEREAIELMVKQRLTEMLADKPEKPKAQEPEKKMSKLKQFLERKKSKPVGSAGFAVALSKTEKVNCPDCGQTIFSDQSWKGCVCFGDDRDNKVFINKTENGISIMFPKSWDSENIKMLLEALKRKNGSKP